MKNACVVISVLLVAAVAFVASADYTPVTEEATATQLVASGKVQGATLNLSATEYFDVLNSTQLVFIADSGAATNVIDADITTP